MSNGATECHLLIKVQAPPLFVTDSEAWDDLVSRSSTNTIFLSSAWLRSWTQVIEDTTQVLTFTAWRESRLVAAVALVASANQLTFAASGFADYSDFIVDQSLSDSDFDNVLTKLLNETKTYANSLDLARIPSVSRTVERLPFIAGWHETETAKTEAPIMDMQFVADRLKKKSIIRHAKKLSKSGELSCHTTAKQAQTEAELDAFFDQHIERWKQTDFPSLFHDEQKRAFYRALTKNLSENKSLRFSTVKLNGHLVAAHFGFFFGGVFTWYKPCFDPEFARYSPGEVLLKHLLEQAKEDQAQFFDFTIGGEAFKFRFASETRYVFTYHLTSSRAIATKRRLRLTASRMLNS